MSSSFGSTDRTERFSALLQPIRDLAQNWSIDVARDLEDYLEELESIQISLDGGRSTLNFAEAAMLIQGSAAVYSRKVEYLYALIYQTLDMITANKKKAAANGGKVKPRDVQDADADELLRHEAEEEFLLLEAVKEGKAVDLKEKREEVELQAALTYGYSGRAHAAAAAAASSLQHMLNLTTLQFEGSSNNNTSNTSMHVGDFSGLPGLNLNITMARSILASPAASKAKSALLAKTPLARMALAGSIGGVSAIGGIGGVGGFGQPGAGIGGFFRVANSSLDYATGALMLPGDGGEHGQQQQHSILTLEPAFIADPVADVDAVTNSVGTMHDKNQPLVAGEGDFINNHDYDDDTGAGGGFDDNGWFHEAPTTTINNAADLDPMAPGALDQQTLQQRDPRLRSAKVSSSSSSTGAVLPPPKKKLDPWAALDPSADLGPSSHRPFIASRTWVHIPDPTLVAARGPEAAAAAIAAQRARILNMGGKADASSLRLAKVLSAQAKQLASRANAVRASGPVIIPKSVFSGGEVAIPHAASSGYSSTLSAMSSSVGPGTTEIFEIGTGGFTEAHYLGLVYVPVDKALATFSSDAAVAASAGARAGCGYEFAHLIARQKAASLRARRSQRNAIAAAFPEQAAAGAAYDDVAFFGGGDEDDYDYDGSGGGGGWGDYDGDDNFNVPAAEVRPAYSDAMNTGERETDVDQPFGQLLGEVIAEDSPPVTGITAAAAAAAAATVRMNLDDPMAFLNDAVQGDAAYKADKASQKSKSEAAMATAIQNAHGLMNSLDGEDDAFHAAVRAQIAAFTANADAFLASSRMQRRIEGWQKRMEPLLQEEEARPEFNMRVYGDRIVKALSTAQKESSKTVDSSSNDEQPLPSQSKASEEERQIVFSSLVNKLKPKPYEICRLFLATLQLANSGNVDIVQQGGGESILDQEAALTSGGKSGPGAGLSTPPIRGQQDSARLGFSIQLLSSVSRFDDIHAFKPPSEQDKVRKDDGQASSFLQNAHIEGDDDDDDDDEEEDNEGEGNYEASVRGKRAKRAREAMIAVLSPTKAKASNRATAAAASKAPSRPPLPPAAEKRGRPLAPTNAITRPLRASKRSKSRDSETASFDGPDENDEAGEKVIGEFDEAEVDEESSATGSRAVEMAKSSSRASSRSKKAIIFGEEEEEETLRSPKGKRSAIR
jgi:hypothetical protein